MTLVVRLVLTALLTALAAFLAPALAAAATAVPRVLPTVERTLRTDAAQKRSCIAAPVDGRGVASRSWTAPDDGVLSVRLRGDERTDWDLGLFDAATDRKLAGSAAFRSNELATTLVTRGQDVTIQGCRRTGTDAAVPLTIDFTAVAPIDRDTKRSLVEIEADTPAEFARIRELGIDTTDHNDGDGQEAILHSPADAQKLLDAGFVFHTKIIDLAAQDAADRASERRFARSGRRADVPSGRTSYRDLDEYQEDMKKLVEDNPRDVRPVTLPIQTLEGRDITGVEIAKDVGRTDDGRPQYVQIGVHHAREWPGGEATMEFGLDLVNRAKSGEARWKTLFEGGRTFVIPIMNVDGFVVTRTVGEQPNDDLPATPGTPQQIVGGAGYKRKNCRPLNAAEAGVPCEARQQNDNGVDPNRNYGEQWGGPGTSSQQNSLVYHGTGPFSEPETQAVRQFLLGKQPTVLITNHTFTGLILRPPGTGDQGPAPDEDRMRKLGDAMAKETDYISQYSYQLYDTTGTTDDWLYGGLGAYSYTPEIGKTNFHPSYTDDFIPEYDGKEETQRGTGEPTGNKLGGLREAYLLAGETALNPDSHGIIRGTAPAGRTLRIKRRFFTTTSARPNDNNVQNPVQTFPEDRESTLTVPANGEFVWHVNPSTRPFEKSDVAWQLTCEDNGKVLESREVFVARAQDVRLDLACAPAAPAPGAQQPPAGTVNATPCTDLASPRTQFRRKQVKLTRKRISIKGTSADQGCTDPTEVRAAGLQRVQVSIARTVSRTKCRFLRADGTFSQARSCRRTSYLTASGTRAWSFAKRLKLKRGEYKIWVRALDKALNIERKDARRNFLRLRVK